MTLPPPQAPFADWPVQIATRAGYIWYAEPGVLVTQSHTDRATLDDTLTMTTRVDAVLRAKKGELAKLRGLLILHDWRSLKTWDNGARELMVERARARKRGVLRAIVVAISVNPLFRLLTQVVNVTMTAMSSVGIDLADSIEPALTKYGVKKPFYGAPFPDAG
jgi:hypothetical protein